MLLRNRSKIVLNEIVCMGVAGLIFISIALSGNNIKILLLLYGSMLTLHFYSTVVNDERKAVVFPLICLFCTYLIFSAIFRGWVSLLLLPYLINIHLIKNHRKLSSLLIIFAAPVIFFVAVKIIDSGTHSETSIQQSWLGVIFLVINSAFSLALKLSIDRMLDEAEQYRNAVCLASANELSERAAKRELIVKQYIVERNIRLQERERISLSIHNAVGHTMSAAIMSLDATKTLYEIDPVLAKEKLLIARDCASQGLEFVRHAVRIIDNDDETINCSDVVSALVAHIEHYNSISEVEINHNLSNFDHSALIPRIHGEFFFNTLLELLSNSRHGDATICNVTFCLDNTHIRMSVSDNGTAFSGLLEKEKSKRLENGFGLKKIEKHVMRFGGVFNISGKDGFTVDISIPIIKE